MTRAEKKLYLTRAKMRRRFGGGDLQAAIPSRFLKEVPAQFVEPLSPERGTSQVDLDAERWEVREAVKRNMYTGKTVNSIEAIGQFFAEKGVKMPSMVPPSQPPPPRPAAPQTSKPAPPQAAKPAPLVGKPLTQTQPPTNHVVKPAFQRPQAAPRKKPFGAGSTVRHPKYGRGTVLRREGDGDDAKLTVSFPGYGLKKLIEKYAGIKED
jgi:DNA helicase-2/ATP-dependent DNA helicase PcrA